MCDATKAHPSLCGCAFVDETCVCDGMEAPPYVCGFPCVEIEVGGTCTCGGHEAPGEFCV